MEQKSSNGLVVQMNWVMDVLQEELQHLMEGTIFVHIRENQVGKFGIQHDAHIEFQDGAYSSDWPSGLAERHLYYMRHVVRQAIEKKQGWTHGEIRFHFLLRGDKFKISTSFESNYNMSTLLTHPTKKPRKS